MLRCDATQQDAVQIERHGRGRVNRQLIGDDPGDSVRIPHDVGRHENIDHRQHQGIDHVGHDQYPHGARATKEDFKLLAQTVHGLASGVAGQQMPPNCSSKCAHSLWCGQKSIRINI